MFKNMKETEKAYISGFFDGDGSVIIHRNPTRRWYGLSIVFANTNKELLLQIREMIGEGCLNSRKDGKKRKMKYKKGWNLYFHGKKAQILLREMLPYLILKKVRAKLALEFPIRNNSFEKLSIQEKAKRVELYHRLKVLNTRGI